jgi:hypothetical protein
VVPWFRYIGAVPYCSRYLARVLRVGWFLSRPQSEVVDGRHTMKNVGSPGSMIIAGEKGPPKRKKDKARGLGRRRHVAGWPRRTLRTNHSIAAVGAGWLTRTEAGKRRASSTLAETASRLHLSASLVGSDTDHYARPSTSHTPETASNTWYCLDCYLPGSRIGRHSNLLVGTVIRCAEPGE